VASHAGGPDETFRIAGLTNPQVVVLAGARVTIQVIHGDPDTAHGMVITASHDLSSWMPMMPARPRSPARRCGSSATPPPPGCTPAP
jgi:hypothetical protein